MSISFKKRIDIESEHLHKKTNPGRPNARSLLKHEEDSSIVTKYQNQKVIKLINSSIDGILLLFMSFLRSMAQ